MTWGVGGGFKNEVIFIQYGDTKRWSRFYRRKMLTLGWHAPFNTSRLKANQFWQVTYSVFK